MVSALGSRVGWNPGLKEWTNERGKRCQGGSDHMLISCTSFERDNHASTSSLNIYRPDALPDAKQTVSKHLRAIWFWFVSSLTLAWNFKLFVVIAEQNCCCLSTAFGRVWNVNLNQQSAVKTTHVYLCAKLSYTIQHRTVLTIFPLILQTAIIAQILSVGGEGNSKPDNWCNNYWCDDFQDRYRNHDFLRKIERNRILYKNRIERKKP